MVQRALTRSIMESLLRFPVVGILGARQVGKTTLARSIQDKIRGGDRRTVYLDLELPSDLNKLQDPELFLGRHLESLVIIDEIQRLPSLFPILRTLVDQKRAAGRFLILSSASPDLVKKSSESLAGRIIYHELTPFMITEVPAKKDPIPTLWLRGGLPDSFLAPDAAASFAWREAYVRTFLERDIPQLGIRIPSPQLRRFWLMICHSHGQIWNASQLAGALGISPPTAKRYLDILAETFIVRQLQPYHGNLKKRLIKSPKIYVRDSGLLHALMSIRTMDDLEGHPVAGHSWEGFIVEQIAPSRPGQQESCFFRTNAGAEIDLVLLKPGKKPIAVEVKYTTTPKATKGFYQGFQDLGCEKGFIVHPGKESYPLAGHITALSVRDLDKITA